MEEAYIYEKKEGKEGKEGKERNNTTYGSFVYFIRDWIRYGNRGDLFSG